MGAKWQDISHYSKMVLCDSFRYIVRMNEIINDLELCLAGRLLFYYASMIFPDYIAVIFHLRFDSIQNDKNDSSIFLLLSRFSISRTTYIFR